MKTGTDLGSSEDEDRLRFTSNQYCPIPEALFRPDIRVEIHEPPTRKQLAATCDGETDRIRPHRKRKK
jgi:hypothetical protein